MIMHQKFTYTIIGIFYYVICLGQENPILLEEFIYEKAPFKSCHAATIAETRSGLTAAWFGGTHEKHEDVEIWFSRKQRQSWSSPVSVADGIEGDKRYPCWNPVLYYSNAGRLYLFYKVGPSPSEWWGMLKYSDDDGTTWSEASQLPEGILGPIKNKPVLIQGNILLCPSSTEHDGWKVQMERYHIEKDEWEQPIHVDPQSAYNVIQPTILKNRDQSLQMLCRSKEGYIISSLSMDQGLSWSELESTSLPNPNSGIDGITLQNGKHILVYNHTGTPEGKWGGNRYPLNVAISKDGQLWRASLVLEQQEGEYSYPAVIQSQNGRIHILYTWNRLKIKHVVLDPGWLPEKVIDIWN
jgi:alpha-L-rhamnosidase